MNESENKETRDDPSQRRRSLRRRSIKRSGTSDPFAEEVRRYVFLEWGKFASKSGFVRADFVDQAFELEYVLRLGAQRELAHHKRLGNSIAVWKNDRVVVIPAEEIVIPLTR